MDVADAVDALVLGMWGRVGSVGCRSFFISRLIMVVVGGTSSAGRELFPKPFAASFAVPSHNKADPSYSQGGPHSRYD